MLTGKTVHKVVASLFLAFWITVFLSGCGKIQEIFSTPTPLIFSSVTPRPSLTPAPLVSQEPSILPSPIMVTPVQSDAGWKPSGKTITVENAAELQMLVNAGQGNPLDMTLSPDGQIIAVSTTNGVYLYNPGNLERLISISTGEQQSSLAFSANSASIASGDWHGKISIWKTTGELQLEIQTGSLPILAVAFSPDGETLAAGCWDGTVRLWNLENGTLLLTNAVRNHAVKAVSFSPDGKSIYAWGPEESVQVWKTVNGKSQDDIYLGKDASSYLPSEALFGQQGQQVAVYYKRNVKVFTTGNGYTRWVLNSLKDSVSGLALSENGNILAILYSGEATEKSIEVYDLQNEIMLTRIVPQNADDISLMALSPDGQTLITTGSTIQTWNLAQDGDQITQARITSSRDFHPGILLGGEAGQDGMVYLAGSEGNLDVFDLTEGEYLPIMPGSVVSGTGIFTAFNILQDSMAGFGDANGVLTLFDLRSHEQTSSQVHTQTVRSLAFSKDGSKIASADEDGKVLVQDLAGESPVIELDAGSAVHHISFFQPDTGVGYLILQTTENCQIWSLNEGVIQNQLAVQAMIVIPNNANLVGVEYGVRQAVNIYHLPDGELVQSFPVEGYRLALSPDGSLLAIGGADLTVWNVSDGTLLTRLTEIPCCGQIQFSSDGTFLAQILTDGSIQVWGIP